MLWGYFSSLGVGKLRVSEGIMDSKMYQEILDENLLPSARVLKLGRSFLFQQDNDPKHMSKSTKAWFHKKKVKVMEWPSQSPDLNPIENLWHELKNRVHKRCPNNLSELKSICQEEWAKIDGNTCENLVKGYKKKIGSCYRKQRLCNQVLKQGVVNFLSCPNNEILNKIVNLRSSTLISRFRSY